MSRKFTFKYLLFLLCLVGMGATTNAQLVTVGTGTTYTYQSPLYSCANFSYTQQIYTAAEILAANGGVVPNGTIVNLRFNLNTNSYNSTTSGSDTWTIYMGNTTTGVFASTASASWIPTTAMTQVFSGTVIFPSPGSWMTIPLTIPFAWDGVSNIVVAVNENNPGGSDCSMAFTATSTSPNYRSMYYYSYGTTNPNPAAPPTASSRSYTRPNVQFLWAVPCATATGYPTTGTVTSSTSSLCLSGNVTLNFTPATPVPSVIGLTYKWQSCPTATGTFVDIPGAITTTPTYTTTTPISSVTYFKCVGLCSGTPVFTSAASAAVTITNPGTVTPTAGARCGPGSVALSATQTISTNVIAWYAAPTGGLSLGSGATFNTPYIPATTTFYVDAETQGSQVVLQVGTGNISNSPYGNPSPFGDDWTATHEQYLITAAELYAAGFAAGNFSSLAFNLTAPYASDPLQFYNVQMANTTVSSLNTTGLITTGFTNVVPQATYTPPAATGWTTLNFATPFYWDGGSNVVVDVSYSNAGPTCTTNYNGNGNGVVEQTATSYTSAHSYFGDANCTINTMNPVNGNNSVFNQRPNMRFNTLPICASPRQAVVATINASPALTITKSAVECSNEIRPMTVTTTPSTNYTNYSWTANPAGLYTNAGATTPYVSGSASTVYVKSSQSNVHTYYLMASGATPAACTHADTVSIFVQPDSISITGYPDTICVSGSTIVTLSPDTGYAPNSIQWQQSANGSGYVNIAGATSASYTTPTLTADHYYRALIKSTNDTCEMPVKHIVVSNPQLLGATDGFNCGAGTVTLNAQSGGNSTLRWYDVPNGGNPVAEGNAFTTPFLGASQIYYVDAEGGTSIPNYATSGTGTSSYGGTSYGEGPFSESSPGFVMQFLYTASDIIAAGGTAGKITSLAFNCTNVPGLPIPNFKIQMKTVPSTMTTLTWQTNMTDVYLNPSFTTAATGWVSFPFSSGVQWNGTDNIVVQVCRDLVNGYSYTGNHQYTYTSGRMLYGYNYSGSSCGTTGSYTSSYLPNAKFGIQTTCASARTAVNAFIRPTPIVDLGQDINYCIDQGGAVVLNAGVQPNGPQFLWKGGSTSQILAVNTTDQYWAQVTNEYTCVGSDTINVQLRHNPVIDLGGDTSVCNGVNLTLDPGNTGVQYFWSTGQTGETITVNQPGSYNVFVTNNEGCTSEDTIQVSMSGELPSIQGVQISNNGQYTFNFTAVNPQNVIGYDWDFGDVSAHSYLPNPSHTYATNGNYIVVLRLSSTCGFLADTASAHIVGIHQVNVSNDELSVFPNPSQGVATISNKGNLKMERIAVYNVLGQAVYDAKSDSSDKHTLKLNGMASGIYTIEIFTDKGNVSRKLEIIN
jgi:hypothetical protein